jgi:glucose-1-phosphate thymidylyltransferase
VSRVLGVIPAAGHARRLGNLPCSKEILPLGYAPGGRPVTACGELLAGMARAGIRRALLLLRAGKWDLPAFFGTGDAEGVELAYRVVQETPNVPATLAAAAPFLGSEMVALGFPDLLWRPPDAWTVLLERQRATGAEVALALFPSRRADKADMVELTADGAVYRLWIKEGRSDLTYSWGLALWTPAFTELLLETAGRPRPAGARELYVGDVLQEALERGMRVEAVSFPGGMVLDMGTPEDLARGVELVAEGEWAR